MMTFGVGASPSSVEGPEARSSRERRGELLPPPEHLLLSLYIGIITSDPSTIGPLLSDLSDLSRSQHIARLFAVVLDNASPHDQLSEVARAARAWGLELAVISVAQQRLEASRGAFGATLRERSEARVGIASARTMLQRYLGALMSMDPGAYGWLLDDDMRIDARAARFLSWLPAFREASCDVLVGTIEGASPNPPLHGVQGQLFDLLCNLRWLRALPRSASLPDRSAENASLRAQFPDYYYDLSRNHTEHLRRPYWIEAKFEGETVASAYARLLKGGCGILRGVPLTRPLVAPLSAAPLASARDTVNRGGNTFVLNHRALSETPNTTLWVGAREARRSDMLWAIINRQRRGMTIKAVGFPVLHVARASEVPTLDIEKVVAEIVGAAVYAALTGFLVDEPRHALSFSRAEAEVIGRMAAQHRERRLERLLESWSRVVSIREDLRLEASAELEHLLSALDDWFSAARFEQVRDGVRSVGAGELEAFLTSLVTTVEDYASAHAVDLKPIVAQLRGGDCS